MYETLIVNGYNLADYCTCIQSIDGLYTIGTPRGENVVFPGVDGETWVDRPFQTATMELGLFLRGSSAADFNSMLRSLRLIMAPGQKLDLVRRTSYLTGNEEHIARGEFGGGLTPQLQFLRFGRVTVTVKVLDGIWYASTTTSTGIPNGGTITVGGETRTHRMTLEMPPGATITNTTNGHTISNTAAAGGIVSINVETMVATQDGVDVSHTLGWNKRFPMRLNPGANYFSGATGNLTYRAAYL